MSSKKVKKKAPKKTLGLEDAPDGVSSGTASEELNSNNERDQAMRLVDNPEQRRSEMLPDVAEKDEADTSRTNVDGADAAPKPAPPLQNNSIEMVINNALDNLSDDKEDDAYGVENKEKVMLERSELFDEIHDDNLTCYPLHKLQDVLNVPSRTLTSLDLTGVTQLTDMFFYTLKNITSLSIVSKHLDRIVIQACPYITDLGIQWMTESLTNLETVNMSACPLVTEASLTRLLHLPKISTVIAIGSGIGVVHFANKNMHCALKLGGCPVVSPPQSTANLQDTLTGENEYFAELAVQAPHGLCKTVVVTCDSVPYSLLQCVTAGKMDTHTARPLHSVSRHQIQPGDGLGHAALLTAIECSVELVSMFACSVTSFVLPYDAEGSAEQASAAVFQHAIYIMGLVPDPMFVVVGVSKGGALACTHASLLAHLTTRFQKFATCLEEQRKDISLSVLVEQKLMDFFTQQRVTKSLALAESLEDVDGFIKSHFKLVTDAIQLHKPEGLAVLEKTLQLSVSHRSELYSTVRRLPQSFTDMVSSVRGNSDLPTEEEIIQQMRGKHGLTFGVKASVYRKSLQVLHQLGQVIMINNPHVQDEHWVVTDVDWFCKAICACLSLTCSKTGSASLCVRPDTPCISGHDLAEEMKAHISEAQVPRMMEVMKMQGLLLQDASMVVASDQLSDEPPVPISHYMRSDVHSERSVCELVYTMTAPPGVLRQLLLQVAALCRPAILWSQGLVAQENPVVIHFGFSVADTEVKVTLSGHMPSGLGADVSPHAESERRTKEIITIMDVLTEMEKSKDTVEDEIIDGNMPPLAALMPQLKSGRHAHHKKVANVIEIETEAEKDVQKERKPDSLANVIEFETEAEKDVKKERKPDPLLEVENMMHLSTFIRDTLCKYRVVVEHFLYSQGISFTKQVHTVTGDIDTDSKVHTVSQNYYEKDPPRIKSCHIMSVPTTKTTAGMCCWSGLVCTHCGISSDICSWLIRKQQEMQPHFIDSSKHLLFPDFKTKTTPFLSKGGWVTMVTGLSTCMLAISAELCPNAFTSLTFTKLDGKCLSVELGNIHEEELSFTEVDDAISIKVKGKGEEPQITSLSNEIWKHGDSLCISVSYTETGQLRYSLRQAGEVLGAVCTDALMTLAVKTQYTNSTFAVSASQLVAEKRFSVGGWQKNMRLEAYISGRFDVATVRDVRPDGSVEIHHDGSDHAFAQWMDPTSADLHPIGYMSQVLSRQPNFKVEPIRRRGRTREPDQEVEPKKSIRKKKKKPAHDHPKDWNSYLMHVAALPMPHSLFTEEQTRGCQPYELSAAARRKLGVDNYCSFTEGYMNSLPRHLPKKLKAMHDCIKFKPPAVKQAPLPLVMDATLLQYPSMLSVATRGNMAAYHLCDNEESGYAHLVDEEGVQFDAPLTLLVDRLLQLTMLLGTVPQLLPAFHKPDTIHVPCLPTKVTKLIKDTGSLAMSQILDGVQQLLEMQCALVLCQLGVAKPSVLQNVYTDIIKPMIKEIKPVCKVHPASALPFLGSTPMEAYSLHYHLVRSLDLRFRKLTQLPEDFFTSFTNLVILNVGENSLDVLPLGIGRCKQLKSLEINKNQLTALPVDFDELADHLEIIDISDNPLVDVPPVLYKFSQLKSLRARHILLRSLHGEHMPTHWQKLETLNFAGNMLRTLPPEFATLKALRLLDLSGVRWLEGMPMMSMSQYDEVMNFYSPIAALSKEERDTLIQGCEGADVGLVSFGGMETLNRRLFMKFPRLEEEKRRTGDLEYGCIPPEVFALENLEDFTFSFQGMVALTDHIKQLTKLVSLNIAINPYLETLSAELSTLKDLKALHVNSCLVLKTPPQEIVRRGLNAIIGYLKRLKLGSVGCRRTKLMMVGLGGAGKTSLVSRLVDAPDLALDFMNKGKEVITDGIDITTWEATGESAEEHCTFNIWDFAGQTVYYNTHQFFLSNRAVYLLLWNIRLGYEHAGLDFWLSSIACHSPKAPVIIVGSHKDQVEKFWLPSEEMQKRYPQIRGFHAISCTTGDGIKLLRKDILNVALKEKYMGENIPEAWLSFEKEMLKKAKTSIKKKMSLFNNPSNVDAGLSIEEAAPPKPEKTRDTLVWREVLTDADKCGIHEESEVQQAIRFLHDLGTVQHFQNEFLKNRVVINPQWIVDAMACVVSVHKTPIKDGHLKHEDIGKVWERFDQSMHMWLLRLTEEFNLTFPWEQEAVNIVPCLLPATKPEQVHWPDVANSPNSSETKTLYEFDYLPAGLFNRAQVRLYQLSDSYTIWKRGSYIRKNGHIGLMTQQSDTQVMVQVQGPRPDNIQFLIHEVFEGLIAESFHGVTYDFFIPCPDCLKVGSLHEPCMFSASKIKRATEHEAPFLQCDRLFHTISLQELHAMMPPSNNSDFELHLERSLRDLDDLQDDLSYDLFMIYAAEDIPKSGEEATKIAPQKIFNDLSTQGFKIWFPSDPSEVTPQSHTVMMRESKAILFCVSNNFVQNEHMIRLFHYVKDNLQKTVQLVVLGSGWQWKESKVGMAICADIYVNMMDPKRYPDKSKELIKAAQEKTHVKQAGAWPECFISYCWLNSADAAKKSGNPASSALGWGDPREIKLFLEKKGVSCWMDVDRVMKGSLYEELSEGLRHAKVMIACVSDEYAASRNCQLEFRFATITLKIPMIVVIVGNGYKWESTEVGMLSLGWPKFNFQHHSSTVFDLLAEELQQQLAEGKEENAGSLESTLETSTTGDSNQKAFQELLELAQRKFLRQAAIYADSMETVAYPRLLLTDFLSEAEKDKRDKERAELAKLIKALSHTMAEIKEEDPSTGADSQKHDGKTDEEEEKKEAAADIKDQADENSGEDGTNERKSSNGERSESRAAGGEDNKSTKGEDNASKSETADGVRPRPDSAKRKILKRKTSQISGNLTSDVDKELDGVKVDDRESDYCVRFLCENEQGWHPTDVAMPLKAVDAEGADAWPDFFEEVAPYLVRLLAVLKYTALSLPILTTPEGKEFTSLMMEKCGSRHSDFKDEYVQLRKLVINEDKTNTMGGLARCQLPNGKVLWLCPEHQKQDRITVLSSETGNAVKSDINGEKYWNIHAKKSTGAPPTSKAGSNKAEPVLAPVTEQTDDINDDEKPTAVSKPSPAPRKSLEKSRKTDLNLNRLMNPIPSSELKAASNIMSHGSTQQGSKACSIM